MTTSMGRWLALTGAILLLLGAVALLSGISPAVVITALLVFLVVAVAVMSLRPSRKRDLPRRRYQQHYHEQYSYLVSAGGISPGVWTSSDAGSASGGGFDPGGGSFGGGGSSGSW